MGQLLWCRALWGVRLLGLCVRPALGIWKESGTTARQGQTPAMPSETDIIGKRNHSGLLSREVVKLAIVTKLSGPRTQANDGKRHLGHPARVAL